jgi:hypothetical protein
MMTTPITTTVEASPSPAAPPTPRKNTRAEQARINGAKSRGPKTAAGKRISSMNGLKHGRRSRNFAILAAQDRAAFDALYQELTHHFAPRTPAQAALVARLASVEWRIARVAAIEIAVLDHEFAIHRAAFEANRSEEAGPALDAAIAASHISRNFRLPDFLAKRSAQCNRERDAILRSLAERQRSFSSAPVRLAQASLNQSLT